MSITPTQIQSLVDSELSNLRDERVKSHIRSLLVVPVVIVREWDYGAPGEAYPCWSVLEHSRSNTGIAYCEFGFGPRSPWGLVMLSGATHMSVGMDSGWFESFLRAYFESTAATDIPIWRAFKQEADDYPGRALTDESDGQSAWDEVRRLRAVDPSAHFHCSQSIQVRRE